jgi:hypothetical protein
VTPAEHIERDRIDRIAVCIVAQLARVAGLGIVQLGIVRLGIARLLVIAPTPSRRRRRRA